jgi:hypothetical protein
MSSKNKDIDGNLADTPNNPGDIESCYQQLLNLFRENGVDGIQQLVEDRGTDQDLLFHILDQALGVLNDIAQREKFKKYFESFKQSMNSTSPQKAVNHYETPMREFGQISTIMQRMELDNLQRQNSVS